MSDQQEPQNRDLTGHIGPLEIDWPRTVGYYGGIGAAVAFGMIDPPVGLFVAAVPFLKMLNRPGAKRPTRMVAEFFDGAAKPVGGDSRSTITLKSSEHAPSHQSESLLTEARRIADRVKSPRPQPTNGAAAR